MRVLVVDDDAAALEIRRLVLERHGFAVAAALSAAEAREAFAAQAPDLVLLDLRLPEISDGLALIRDFHPAKMIVLCGNAADLDHRPEVALVSAILRKPVRSEVLIKTIQNA